MSILHIPAYGAWLTGQVVIAATEVIVDTFRGRQKQKPILIGMPLRITTDTEIVGLSASITMTPGTLVCGIRALEGGRRMFIIHAVFGADFEGVCDSLYGMEERMAPRVRDLPRPEAFVFDDYDPEVHSNPDEVIGTAAETEQGLPGLPDSVTVVDDPMEDDVIPEPATDGGGPGDRDGGVVKHDGPAPSDRKENRHE